MDEKTKRQDEYQGADAPNFDLEAGPGNDIPEEAKDGGADK